MANSLQGIPKGSLVHRFITCGKPGRCELCLSKVEKLEAHHLSYSPEKTIKLCHACHHKVHFWPTRLSSSHQLKLLSRRLDVKTAHVLVETGKLNLITLAKMIAPSRSAHIKKMQRLEIKRIAPKHHKVYKKAKSGKHEIVAGKTISFISTERHSGALS